MKAYKPMLAKIANTPFSSKDWIFEVKWDGIRAISYVNDDLSIKSRNQKELRTNFPELEELKSLTKNAVLDGEIILMREGKVDFETLLKRVQVNSTKKINFFQKKYPVLYILFDILEKDQKSLLDKPLFERKKILEDSVKEGKNVIISIYAEENGTSYYDATIQKGLEGVIAKKKNSFYESGKRSEDWLKIKPIKECDCVIFGYTNGTGNRKETFGALILGLYKEKNPIFVGKVGTGFKQKTLVKIKKILSEISVEYKTLNNIDLFEEITWVFPKIVCKIGYQSLTSDLKLRIPRFLGLRLDKNPEECKFDQIQSINLKEYWKKRDFTKTPEPSGSQKLIEKKIFIVQEHDASHLHYDFRLEKDNVLKSWAVPKGIPKNSGIKRLAIKTEDHPLDYAEFQGTIPKGQYGAGTVKTWDKGHYKTKYWGENKIEINLQGRKLKGNYALINFKKGGEKNWLLIKVGDNK